MSRQKAISKAVGVITAIIFLWTYCVCAEELTHLPTNLAPSTNLPILYRDAAIEHIALDTLRTLASSEMGDIKVFYKKAIEENIIKSGKNIRCFGIRDMDSEKKGKWALYMVDLENMEITRYLSDRDVRDRFFHVLETIESSRSRIIESGVFKLGRNKFTRDRFLITPRTLPFIKTCLDRLFVYPIEINIGGFTKNLLKEYITDRDRVERERVDISKIEGEELKQLLEETLRAYNIIKPDEKFMGYTETLDWERGGGETYIAKGLVRIRTPRGTLTDREFIAKAIVKMFPEHHGEQWQGRMNLLSRMTVRIPESYSYSKATFYQEVIPFTAEEVLKRADSAKRKELLEKLAYIVCVLDTFGFWPIEVLHSLRSDGEEFYYVDVGEDLGGYKGKPNKESRSLDVLKKQLNERISGLDLRPLEETYEKIKPEIQENASQLGLIPYIIEGIAFSKEEYEEILRLREYVKDKTVLFIGPSNSGKGFFGQRVARILGLEHISFGDLVREVGSSTRNSRLKRAIEQTSRSGGLLEEKHTKTILKEGLKDKPSGIILDGFPRTLNQARMLDKIKPVDLVIYLDPPEGLLYDRIESRVACSNCGEVYSTRFTRPENGKFRCDRCGGELTRRTTPDGRYIDTRETLERKLQTYKDQILPIIGYYSKKGLVQRFDLIASDDTPEDLLEKTYDTKTERRDVYSTSDGKKILNYAGGTKKLISLFRPPAYEIQQFLNDNSSATPQEIQDKIDEVYKKLADNTNLPPHIMAKWRLELYIAAFKEQDTNFSQSLLKIHRELTQPKSDLAQFVLNLAGESRIPAVRIYKAIFPNYDEAKNSVGVFEFTFSPEEYFRIMRLGINLEDKFIVIQGPPASGKGHYGQRLASILGMKHTSFGDEMRKIGRTTTDTDLRRAIQDASDSGGIIPDEYAFRVAKNIISSHAGGIILEGFPRTETQGAWLVEETSINAVIGIDVPIAVLSDRVQNRVMCPECGLVYNLMFDEFPDGEPRCKKDGALLARRTAADGTVKDTDRSVFENRIGFYRQRTLPLWGFFDRAGIFRSVSSRVMPDEDIPDSLLQRANIGGKRTIYHVEEDGQSIKILNENGFIRKWLDVLEEIAGAEENHPLTKTGHAEEKTLFSITFNELGKEVKTTEKEKTEKSALYNKQYTVDALGTLVDEYGPGILSGIKEAEIVDRTGPTGRRINNKAQIDIDIYGNKNLVVEFFEHEALHEILGLIIPDNPDLAEVVATWYSAKRFVNLSSEAQQDIIDLLKDTSNGLDPEGKHTAFLEYIRSEELTGDDLISAVAGYLNLKNLELQEIKEAHGALNEALELFNDLIKAGCGKEIARQVKEAEKEMLRVIKTFNDVRIIGKASSKVRKLVGHIVRHDKFCLPEGLDISRKKYILLNKERVSDELRGIINELQKSNIEIKYNLKEVPPGADVVVLVDPQDVEKWKDKKTSYLPLPYMKLSLYLAAELVLLEQNDIKNTNVYGFVKEFYEVLFDRELIESEVIALFHAPWEIILPEIDSGLIADLNILRIAISAIEKDA